MTTFSPSPTTINLNPIAWWDFSDVTGISFATNISQIIDDSVNLINIFQNVGGLQPLYDTTRFTKNTAKFATGGNEFGLGGINIGSGSGYENLTIMMVVSPTSGDKTEGFLISKDASGGNVGDSSVIYSNGGDGTVLFYTNDEGISVRSSSVIDDNKMHVITITTSKKSGSQMYIDGILENEEITALTKIWNNATNLELGSAILSTRSFFGNIGECILYDTIPTEPQRKHLESYMMAKWNIAKKPFRTEGLINWLDAGDRNNFTLDIDVVEAWIDKSDLSEDANQGIVALRPTWVPSGLNGLPTVKFDGIDDVLISAVDLRVTTNPEMTIYVVCQYSGTDSGVFGNNGPSYGRYLLENSSSIPGKTIASYEDVKDTMVYDADDQYTPLILRIDYSTTDNRSLTSSVLNELDISTQTSPGLDTMGIGAISPVGTNPFTGDISEMIVFDRTLTDSDNAEVSNYLSKKWKIELPGIRKTDLDIWVDPNEYDRVTLNGTAISSIIDRSVNENEFTQTTAINQPLWGTDSLPIRSIHNGASTDLIGFNYGASAGFQDLTLMMTIQVDSSLNESYPLSKEYGGVNPGDLSLLYSSNTYSNIGNISIDDQGNGIEIGGLAYLNDGAPHVVTFTLSSTGGYKLYVDGVLDASNATTGNTIWNNSSILEIGGVFSGTYETFEGYISDCLIWSDALTQIERERAEKYLSYRSGADYVDIPMTNLSLWLDGNARSTITYSGANVETWADRSLNGNDASQFVLSDQPIYIPNLINGRGAVRFDGVSEYLISPINIDIATNPTVNVFVVFQYTASNSGVFGQDNGGWDKLLVMDNPSFPGNSTVGFNDSDGPISYPKESTGIPHLSTIRYIPAGASVFSDRINVGTDTIGTQNSGTSTTAIGAVNITGTLPFTGDIGEILMYTGALTAEEVAKVERYLYKKWGI